MQMNQLTRKTPNTKHVQVGRGGKRGKTAGRGTKGQNARGNTRKRPQLRDIIKKIPKKRGYGKNRAKSNYEKPEVFPVNLGLLDSVFESGATISPVSLLEKGILKSVRLPKAGVKVLATGTLTKKFHITDCTISATAKEKVLAAGGTVA